MNDLMKILIAYDGSDCADQALDDLGRAGLPSQVEAYIVTVAEVWSPEPVIEDDSDDPDSMPATVTRSRRHSEAVRQEARQEARQFAKTAARRLQDRFPDWIIHTAVNSDSPAYGVLGEADGIDPDLIVVGSHGRSALGRLVLGSVSQTILSDARCSVRIARHHPAVEGSPVRIVLGVDGTPDSDAAVTTVAARGWPKGSAVQVVAAHGLIDVEIPPDDSPASFSLSEGIEERMRMLEKATGEAASKLRAAGLAATAVVKDGAPIPVLLDLAREWGADCIVVGAQGHRFMEQILLGSVSAAVAARAHCSVEVIRTKR